MYGYSGSMKTVPGCRDDVVEILLRGIDHLRDAGCRLYLVSVSDDEPDSIYINEVWESREHHHASLNLPQTQAAIAAAMPMLSGDFSSQELTVVGGLGVDLTG